MEGRMEIPVKTKNKTTYDLAIPLLGVYPEEKTEKRHMHPSVHCSTIYNNQDMKATYTSTNRWMDKEAVVHTCNGILLIHIKEAHLSLF